MLIFRRPVAAFLMVLAACCPAVAADWMTDLEAAKQEAKKLNRPILVHFYASWCAPCMHMERSVLNTPKVLDQIKSSVVAVKVNIDDHPDLANRFGVTQFPTDVFIEPTGEHLSKATGKRTIDEYTDSIARMSTRYTDRVNERLARQNQSKPATEANLAAAPTEAMLRGYCPVTLWNRRKWEKGSPQFSRVYNGQTYWMVSEKMLKEFDENPNRFAPQLLGCDPVIVAKDDRAVPGNTKFGAFYDDELYLFTNDDNRKTFKANPDRYVRERVVLNVDQIEVVAR